MKNEEMREIEKWIEHGHVPSRDATMLISEIRRLREALEWYADRDHYTLISRPDNRTEAERDEGKRARKALEGK